MAELIFRETIFFEDFRAELGLTLFNLLIYKNKKRVYLGSAGQHRPDGEEMLMDVGRSVDVRGTQGSVVLFRLVLPILDYWF